MFPESQKWGREVEWDKVVFFWVVCPECEQALLKQRGDGCMWGGLWGARGSLGRELEEKTSPRQAAVFSRPDSSLEKEAKQLCCSALPLNPDFPDANKAWFWG